MTKKYFLLVCFTYLFLQNLQAFAADSYVVGASATVTIDEHSVCKKVSNSLGAGVMVPTKTANEWNTGGSSFLENLYAGVTISDCDGSIPCGEFTELGDIIPAGFPAFVPAEHRYSYALHQPTGKVISVFEYGVSPTVDIEIMAITPPNGTTILQSTLDTARVTVASGDVTGPSFRGKKLSIINDYIFVTYIGSDTFTHQKMYSFDGTNFTLVDELVGTTNQHYKAIYAYDGTYYLGQDGILNTAGSTPKLASWELIGSTLTQKTVSPPVGYGNASSGTAFKSILYDNGYIFAPLEGYVRAYTYDGSSFTAASSAQLVTAAGLGGSILKYDNMYIYNNNYGDTTFIRLFEFDGASFTFKSPSIQLGDGGSPYLANDIIESDGYNIYFGNFAEVSPETLTGIGSALFNTTTQKLDIAEYLVTSPLPPSAYDLVTTSPTRISHGNKYYEHGAGSCGAGASCALPAVSGGGTIPDGSSIAMYEVPSGGCNEELRVCTNGTLSGTNQYVGCTKVICTHYHAKGLLSDYLYDGEKIYAELIDPRIMTGYHYWAIPAVKWLKRNPWIDPIIAPLVREWATEVNHRLDRVEKGSVVGKVLLSIAEPVSVWIADYVVGKDDNSKKPVKGNRMFKNQ